MSDPTNVVNTDSTIPANVLPIKGKGTKAQAKKGPKKAALDEMIFGAITDNPARTLPLTKFKIAIVEINEGVKTPVQILPNGQCRRITLKQVAALIMNFTRTELMGYETFRYGAWECTEAANYWEMASSPIEMPAHVRFLNDPGLCWSRLPFDRDKRPTPLWDDFFSLMSENSGAIKAWIGSLFFPESYLQQFVWIQGKGNDGKSAMLRFLKRVFGASALPQTKAPSGEHWAEPYPGKRLVFFPDFKDFNSLENGPLKQLTGGDDILVNPKNQSAYMATLCAKYIFSSQQKPPLNMDFSIIRRLIFTEMRFTEKTFNSSWEDDLWGEGASFLNSCIETFHALCPDPKQPIPVSGESKDQLVAWGARTEDQCQLWFDEYLVVDEKSFLLPNDLAQRIRIRFHKKSEWDAVYDFLDQKGFKRTKQSSLINKSRPWIYDGLRLSTKLPRID